MSGRQIPDGVLCLKEQGNYVINQDQGLRIAFKQHNIELISKLVYLAS